MLFRFARVSRIVAAVLTFATLFLITTSPVAQSAPRRPLPRAAAQEVFAPYWTSEPGWDTELQLKNNLSSGQLTVTPVLRLASGEEISLDPVTIASHTSVSVWVNEGLLKHSPGQLNQPGSYGSVVFRFTSFHARAQSLCSRDPSAAWRPYRLQHRRIPHPRIGALAACRARRQPGRYLVASAPG
jgi:hypothetical protein